MLPRLSAYSHFSQRGALVLCALLGTAVCCTTPAETGPLFEGLALTPVPAQPPTEYAARTEMRAGWVVSWRQMISPQAIDDAVDWAASARLNTLFAQVRASGDAYYRSDRVPRAETLSEQPASFDPLAHILESARARSMKVHAWFNTGVVWRHAEPPKDPRHIFNAHSEWVLRDASGNLAFPSDNDPVPSVVEDKYWLDWGDPAARAHLADVARELMERYPVDGLHLDFVRYPARMGPRALGVGYGRVAMRRFREETGLEPRDFLPAWDRWRADQVTAGIREIRAAVSPSLRRPLSAAVLGAWDLAYGRAFTDYRHWLEEGVLDFAVPMAYSSSFKRVRKNARSGTEIAAPGRILLGLRIKGNSPLQLGRMIRLTRREGLKGFALFALDNEEDLEIGRFLTQLRSLAIPDPTDRRLSDRDPTWARVGDLDDEQREFRSRIYTRGGRGKLVVYPGKMESVQMSIEEQDIPVLYSRGRQVIQLDVSSLLDPESRNVAANHDFLVEASGRGPRGARAQIFFVDAVRQPAAKAALGLSDPRVGPRVGP